MPEMDGIKSTFNIRQFLEKKMMLERRQQPKIIGITGHAHNKFKDEGLNAGMDRVEIKPCYFSVTDNIVQEMELLQE